MSTFTYYSLPLNHEEIRILELLPPVWPGEPIQARIFKRPLDNLPSFSALSYTWGNESIRADISLGGQKLSITASLEAALKALRAADHSVLLWIDQICINQHDAEEKSCQIPLMTSIYSLSAQTIGWLGESTADSDLAMDYLQDVGSRAKALGLAKLDATQLQALLVDDADIVFGMNAMEESTAEMRRNDPTLHAALLPKGLGSEELAIPRTLMLQWGNKTTCAEVFAAGINFHLVYVAKSMTTPMARSIFAMPLARALLERVRSVNVTNHIYPSLAMRNWYHSPKRATLTMASLLERLRRVKFSQRGDRIYGILGLAADIGYLKLEVDVARTWEEVFTHATKRIVNATAADEQSRGGINFLSLVSFPKASKALPSWVPDFTSLDNVKTLRGDTTTLSPPYHASGRMTHTMLWDDQDLFGPEVLRCRGVVVDRITEVGLAWEVDPSGQHLHSAGLGPLSSVAELAAMSAAIVTSDPFSKHPFRGQPQRLVEAEWRVPILGRESVSSTGASCRATQRSRRGHEMVKYTMAFDRESHDVYKVLANIHITPQEEVELSRMHLSYQDRQVAEVEMKMEKNNACNESPEHSTYKLLMDAFRERRSFLGAAGFVGVGPLGVRAGDVICVFYGGSFPYILREVESGVTWGTYELVGEAYCDGIMDGEALTMGIADQECMLV
ncbi:hypothetical protein DL765_002080 [Monosporascus sp. GIB2]|nr:hypothetical protein DL765_002080 [Monosporascus sp. GIB2]